MCLYFEEYGELEEISINEYIGGGWSLYDVARSLDDGEEYNILISGTSGAFYYSAL